MGGPAGQEVFNNFDIVRLLSLLSLTRVIRKVYLSIPKLRGFRETKNLLLSLLLVSCVHVIVALAAVLVVVLGLLLLVSGRY